MRLDSELLKRAGVFAFVSGQLVVCVGGAALLGGWIDEKLSTGPLATVTLCILGLAYSVWRISQWVKK